MGTIKDCLVFGYVLQKEIGELSWDISVKIDQRLVGRQKEREVRCFPLNRRLKIFPTPLPDSILAFALAVNIEAWLENERWVA